MAILAVLVAFGAGAEWLFRRWLGGRQAAAAQGDGDERPLSCSVGFIPLVVFALASAGLFLLFELAAADAALRAHFAERGDRLPRGAHRLRPVAQATRVLSRFGESACWSSTTARQRSGSPGCSFSPGSSCSAGRWSA